MTNCSNPEELALWQRRLASQANNRAWTLAESLDRSPAEDEEMLHAAHAAMFYWCIVGSENNKAHAAQLLAHVYALLKLPNPAAHYLKKAKPVFLDQDSAPWEKAFTHLITANVAAASGQHELHTKHYRLAQELVASLESEEERNILLASVRVVPQPNHESVV